MPSGNPKKRSRGGSRAAPEAHRAEEARAVPVSRPSGDEHRPLQFTRLNWLLLGAAAVVLVAGYVALSSDSPALSTIVGPVLLVGAYAVLIPLGLIL